MINKNNVIDLAERRRQLGKQKEQPKEKTSAKSPASVQDITEIRAEMIQQERRQVKRTILTEFIGAFCVIPQSGLQKVALYDISENGMAFDVDKKLGPLREGEEVAMRVYMNQTTYFPFVVKVRNAREIADEGVYRHGVNFVKGTINDVALHHFVRFIETVAASLRRDSGDVMVSNLTE